MQLLPKRLSCLMLQSNFWGAIYNLQTMIRTKANDTTRVIQT